MVSEQEEIYQERILDHYEDPYHRGQCDNPTHRHQEKNPLCGDVIQIELRLDADGLIREVYFDGDGCRISQAAASILAEHMDGKTVDEIRDFTADDMLELFGPKLSVLRQKCCLLSWKVLRSVVHSPINGQSSDGPSPDGQTSDSKSPGDEASDGEGSS